MTTKPQAVTESKIQCVESHEAGERCYDRHKLSVIPTELPGINTYGLAAIL
ncbi:MAG TPA: hypothetical protein V6D18_13955 [Thermosynechococcaceae cyanobacterium]